MADKSLDEIIASKGLNFKVQFQNQDARKKIQGKVFQQGGQGRQGFPSNKNRFPGPQKRPFSAPAQQQKQAVTGPRMQSHANGGSLAGPGKGQIDARDMITIKNRIKIPDARAKIIQKRLQKGNFDARSKLKPKAAQGNQNQKGMKKVSVNTSRAPGPGSAPTLTRTLMNPLAAGGALVEDTGSSLKITRSIPDVTFDGGSLTITRRLPPSGPNQEASQFASSGQRVNMDRDKGPVIQIRNEKFRPQPVQAPGGSVKSRPTASPAMGARSYSQPQAAVSTRPPAKLATRSPIQLPVRTPVQSPSQAPVQHPQRTSVQSAPSASAFSGNSRYKYTSTAASARTETSLESQGRLKPPPVVEAARRPAQSALSRIQMQAQADTTQTRGVSPRQPAMKRLAPASSYQAYEHTADVEVSTTQRAGVKRRAPLSLSDRFASGGGGNPIPVITDHAPKKRRTPAPVPVEPMEEFVEDFEKEQFEEQEEDPAPTLLSPLQGFCILVSNLHSSVTQDDIIELFAAIGPLKRANLLQRGQAEVAFIHREHAIMALKKYHNRELDGQPMFVKLVTPINAKVMKTPATAEENAPALPPSLKASKKPAEPSAPVEIPLIHKALFKTGSPTQGKSVRFTVKI